MNKSDSKKNVAKILLVDDNETFCTNIRHYFEKRSNEDSNYFYRIETETESAQALRRINEFCPHVVVLDHFFDGQKESGFDIFWKIINRFSDRIRDRTLAMIYYSKSDESSDNDDLQRRFLERGLEEPGDAIIRLKKEYESSDLLEYDVCMLLRGILSTQPEETTICDCETCCLHIDFLQDWLFIGRGYNKLSLFKRKKIARNIIIYLASEPGKWRSVEQIKEYCWRGGSDKESVQRYLRALPGKFHEETGHDTFFRYIEHSDDTYRMRETMSCLCDDNCHG